MQVNYASHVVFLCRAGGTPAHLTAGYVCLFAETIPIPFTSPRESIVDYGHFSEDGREYIITRVPTPRPWDNYLSNPTYGMKIDAVGSGHSRLPVTPGNRITRAEPGQVFYLKDNESPAYWSLTFGPVGGDCESYQCRHGVGYSIFEMKKEGIESSLRAFVPLQDQCEVWTISLRNATDRPRKLTLFPFTEWHLAPLFVAWDNYCNYVQSHYVGDEQLIVATLAEPSNSGQYYHAFAGVSAPIAGYENETAVFTGAGGLLAPAAVVSGACTNGDMPGDGRACAAFAVPIELAPGEEKSINLLVGYAGDPETRARLKQSYLDPGAAAVEFQRVLEYWRKLEAQPLIETPDPRVDRMTNLWLKYNALMLTQVIRENYRGYRDMLQDALAVASFAPEAAKEIILLGCASLYPDGHAPRQVAYAGQEHDLRVYNDSPLWLILALTRYLKETGEMALLDEQTGFFLAEGQASVFEHARLAVDWLNGKRGWHDLIRIDRGDWCDALTGVGPEGKGISVWLTQAFHLAVVEFAELCQATGRAEMAAHYRDIAAGIDAALQEHAWDGNWYLAAISDKGVRLGKAGDKAMEIYVNSQSWAIIGQCTPPERAAACLDAADAKLSSKWGPLTINPPYFSYDPNVGRLSVLRPGCGENGTVYVHAAVFYALANFMARRPDRALEVFEQICPLMEGHDPAVTHAAPYAFVNSYVGPSYPSHEGRTTTNWYTSSCNWTFLIMTDYLLGVRAEYDGLRLDPVLPTAWEGARLRRNWRGADYDIVIRKPAGVVGRVKSVTVDGKPRGGQLLPVFADGALHGVEVELG